MRITVTTELTCFKAYDIRGQLGEQLNADVAYRIGRAMGEILKPKDVVVGGDVRLTSEELKLALKYEEVTFIQMPYNILDHRWEKMIEKIQAVKKERNLTIHVRSSLLQGLLLTDDYSLWEKANVSNPNVVTQYLNNMIKETKCDSILELCLTYVRSLNWIDGVVVGMETVSQLKDNLNLFSREVFPFDTLKLIDKHKPILLETTLNPSHWKN